MTQMEQVVSTEPVRSDYDESKVQVLEGTEHVRKRPSMYIGDTTLRGLHHLVYEVVDNSVDEAMAGACKNISVEIAADGAVTVEDDGRGIPVGVKPEFGMSVLELCLTKLGAGGKFGDGAYKVSGGLHGVGVSVVNALSERMDAQVNRDGKTWAMRFIRGKTVSPLEAIGTTSRTGTRITFLPDAEIFPERAFRYETLANRLRELAYLNSGLRITIRDDRENKSDEFQFQRGIVEFVEHLNEGKDPLHQPVFFQREDRDARLIVEIAFQYTDSYSETQLAFANNINTVEGGTHLTGFRSALTRAINNYGRKAQLFKNNDPTPTGEDAREGLTAIVSVKVPEPQFEGQTKTKLGNSEVGTFVETTVNEMMANYLEEHPSDAKRIVTKAVQAALAREAARKARETARKSVMAGAGMSRKLVDCSSRNADETELFIVEGDSAAGSAKGHRDTRTQAILPIRGKILNVEKARKHKVLDHQEIVEIIKAIGTGIGDEDFDIQKLRYGKIILMTDADVDGSHIRTLLLTFFFRHMRQLIDRGVVFVAQPPLFQIAKGKKSEYVLDDGELDRRMTQIGLAGTTLEIHRDGEAPRTLSDDELSRLTALIKGIERQAAVLARRGIPFQPFIDEHYVSGRLPIIRALVGNDERFFHDEEAFNDFRRTAVAGGEPSQTAPSNAAEPSTRVIRQDLSECKALELAFAELLDFGCSSDDLFLVRRELETGDRTAATFVLRPQDGEPVEVENLRTLLEGIRSIGARGAEIKRFKGLGEMNKEQLWETTMDPANRVMRRVVVSETSEDAEQVDIDAKEADRMFSILMGEDVEKRKNFIETNAIHVRNLDV